MSQVFVLDTNKKPLDPVHPGRARLLLKAGKAAIWRRYPFTIILTYAIPVPQVDPLRLKLDPGSRTTGIAVMNDTTGEVVFAAELSHRGHNISEAHLKRYLAEFDFRYNTRVALGVNDETRTEKMLKGIVGKRITYRRIDEAANA